MLEHIAILLLGTRYCFAICGCNNTGHSQGKTLSYCWKTSHDDNQVGFDSAITSFFQTLFESFWGDKDWGSNVHTLKAQLVSCDTLGHWIPIKERLIAV